MDKKRKIIELINKVEDDRILDYLLEFVANFISYHSKK